MAVRQLLQSYRASSGQSWGLDQDLWGARVSMLSFHDRLPLASAPLQYLSSLLYQVRKKESNLYLSLHSTLSER